MNSVITFVEFENQVISATYRNLMIGAKVVLVDNDERARSCPNPSSGSHRRPPTVRFGIRLPAAVQAGDLLPARIERRMASISRKALPFRIG